MITWKGAADLQAEQLIAYGFQFSGHGKKLPLWTIHICL